MFYPIMYYHTVSNYFKKIRKKIFLNNICLTFNFAELIIRPSAAAFQKNRSAPLSPDEPRFHAGNNGCNYKSLGLEGLTEY
jgi:hypothetical protein